MSPITTHILNTMTGKPASAVPVRLEFQNQSESWQMIAEAETNSDGRIMDLLPENHTLSTGTYRMNFAVKEYFAGQETFYPHVTICFEIKNPGEHYHVPLLLSPFGYSTYRGS